MTSKQNSNETEVCKDCKLVLKECICTEKTNTKKDVSTYITEIDAFSKKTTVSLLEMSFVALKAKKELSKTSYMLFEQRVRFSSSSLRKLHSIAYKYDLFKKYADKLSYNYTTLYKISQLSKERIIELAESDQLHADMTSEEVAQLAKSKDDYEDDVETENEYELEEDGTVEYDTSNTISVTFSTYLDIETVLEIQNFLNQLSEKVSCQIDCAFLDSILENQKDAA